MDYVRKSIDLYKQDFKVVKQARGAYVPKSDEAYLITVRLCKWGDQLQLRIYINGTCFTYNVDDDREFDMLVKKYNLREFHENWNYMP